MLYILLFIAILLCLLHIAINYNKKANILSKIPGPPGKFVIGNALDVFVDPVQLFNIGRKWANTYNNLYKLWSFPIGAINIYNPEDVEIVLSSTKHNEKSFAYPLFKAWLGDGLLLSSGEKWFRRRKILTPAFHFQILRHFCEVLEENSHRLIKKLEDEADEVTNSKINVVPILSDYTLNSICETAMGTQLDEELIDEGIRYKAAIHEIGKLIFLRFSRIFYFCDFIFNLSSIGRKQRKLVAVIKGFTQKIIKERKKLVQEHGFKIEDYMDNSMAIYKNNNKKKLAMLDLLLAAEKDGLIDSYGIQEEVDTFTFEGHDTTGQALVYMMMLLANNKTIQEKVVAELDDVFGNSTRNATQQDLAQLKYLDCCIKESMRLYPPVSFIGRKLDKPIKLSNYEVPAGTHCHIHIFDLHRRAGLYKEPLVFNPDRFLPENCVDRHPYAYIPFSAGPRNCIGQRFAMLEMKSVLAATLRKFELHPVTKPKDLILISDVVLRTKNPVYVTFMKRK